MVIYGSTFCRCDEKSTKRKRVDAVQVGERMRTVKRNDFKVGIGNAFSDDQHGRADMFSAGN